MNLFMFPGQGSQKVGMGKDAFDFCDSAKNVFLEVDDALSMKMSDLIFNGTDAQLTSTENAQVALMTVSMAYVKVLEHLGGKIDGFVAGHSLGEYTALCAAGVISLSDTAKLLWTRGKAMKKCAPSGYGMLAIIGLNYSQVEELLKRIHSDEFIEIANDNSAIQVIVSGSIAGLQIIADAAKEAGAMNTVMLNVSGPFHSSKMQAAADELRIALENVKFNEPKCPLIANYTAQKETANFKTLLLKQIINKVRWTESILKAAEYSVTTAIEVGPGRVLTGLVKRITPSMKLVNVNNIEGAKAFIG